MQHSRIELRTKATALDAYVIKTDFARLVPAPWVCKESIPPESQSITMALAEQDHPMSEQDYSGVSDVTAEHWFAFDLESHSGAWARLALIGIGLAKGVRAAVI